MKTEIFCISDGEKITHNQRAFRQALREHEGKIIITVEKYKAKRSSPQNRLYFLYIGMIQDEFKRLGNLVDKEQVHEYFKAMFLKQEAYTGEGEVLIFSKSTTKLTKDEFSEYIEHIKQWSIETIGLYLPESNTQMSL